MCNLYSTAANQQANRNLFKVKWDRAGNLPILPGIFPDQTAPIMRRSTEGERELIMARWGMPTPPQFRQGLVDRDVTHVRNVASPPSDKISSRFSHSAGHFNLGKLLRAEAVCGNPRARILEFACEVLEPFVINVRENISIGTGG